MANCKKDFINHTNGKDILCAEIIERKAIEDEVALLKIGFDDNDYECFLNKIDYYYDNSYRSRGVSAIVWYKDGTWSETGSIDDDCWWKHISKPVIPEYLK